MVQTQYINLGDIECLEVKYKKTLKCMLSLPDCTTYAVVYLFIPQLHNTLTFYGFNFPGWSDLVRKTKHSLSDSLQYLEYPWRPDRWRHYCKKLSQTNGKRTHPNSCLGFLVTQIYNKYL
jgi:hypothetical protein